MPMSRLAAGGFATDSPVTPSSDTQIALPAVPPVAMNRPSRATKHGPVSVVLNRDAQVVSTGGTRPNNRRRP